MEPNPKTFDRAALAALAATGAELIADGFERYLARFRALTAKARDNFERSDWPAIQRGSKSRLDLYGGFVVQSVTAIRELLGEHAGEQETWAEIRSAFERRISHHPERETSPRPTSIRTRPWTGVFHTVGVDPRVEFVRAETFPVRYGPPWSFTTVYHPEATLEATLRTILRDTGFSIPWDDLEGDASRVAAALAAHVSPADVEAIELVRAPFFRGKGAYLAGGFRHVPEGFRSSSRSGTPAGRPGRRRPVLERRSEHRLQFRPHLLPRRTWTGEGDGRLPRHDPPAKADRRIWSALGSQAREDGALPHAAPASREERRSVRDRARAARAWSWSSSRFPGSTSSSR